MLCQDLFIDDLKRMISFLLYNECKKTKKKKNFYFYDALFITGGSVHHGNEENLPKAKSECSMCQGQRSVYFPDVRFLPLHRGRF